MHGTCISKTDCAGDSTASHGVGRRPANGQIKDLVAAAPHDEDPVGVAESILAVGGGANQIAFNAAVFHGVLSEDPEAVAVTRDYVARARLTSANHCPHVIRPTDSGAVVGKSLHSRPVGADVVALNDVTRRVADADPVAGVARNDVTLMFRQAADPVAAALQFVNQLEIGDDPTKATQVSNIRSNEPPAERSRGDGGIKCHYRLSGQDLAPIGVDGVRNEPRQSTDERSGTQEFKALRIDCEAAGIIRRNEQFDTIPPVAAG